MRSEGEPTLSILVPTYNYAHFIGHAISSAVDQAQPGVEILVADDGSTDETEQVLRPWVATGQVRHLRQDNSGPSTARNLAMEAARGRFWMFLDADDALLPGCIAATLEFMERHPEVGLFFTNYEIFDESGLVAASGVDTWESYRQIPHREMEDGWIFEEPLTPYIIRHGSFMHTSGLTIRREVAREAGKFLEGFFYGEDDEYWARAAYRCKSGYVDRVLSRKRNHPMSLINDRANRLRNAKHIMELTEIQASYYRNDPELQRILETKIRRCSEDYVRVLIDRRRVTEALAALRRFRSRYPLHLPFYTLMAKALLLKDRPDPRE